MQVSVISVWLALFLSVLVDASTNKYVYVYPDCTNVKLPRQDLFSRFVPSGMKPAQTAGLLNLRCSPWKIYVYVEAPYSEFSSRYYCVGGSYIQQICGTGAHWCCAKLWVGESVNSGHAFEMDEIVVH